MVSVIARSWWDGRCRSFAREEIFLTTKVLPDNVRHDDLLRALDGSLERLQTDYVDLYLIHSPNPDVALEESFKALNRVAAEGRVKRVGVSNFDVPLLRQAQELCETPVVTNQVRYNLYTRAPEQDGLLRYCQENNIVLTAYSPLEGWGDAERDGTGGCPQAWRNGRPDCDTLADAAAAGGNYTDVDEPGTSETESGSADVGVG